MLKFRRVFVRSMFLLSNRNSFSSRTCDTVLSSTQILFHSPSKPSNNCSVNHLVKPYEFPVSFCSSSSGISDADDEHDEDELKNNDDDVFSESKESVKSPEHEKEVKLIMDIIRGPLDRDYDAVSNNLDKCGVPVSHELVSDVLSRVRNDWKVALLFFSWAEKQPDYAHGIRQYHCMIAILGKMKRFDTAWRLVGEMKNGGKNGGESMVIPQTLLLMIKKHAAVHDVSKAINTFYVYERFGCKAGDREFHDLLYALCEYKNVKEAEDLMKRHQDVYPLCTKSYNIILNGWCNILNKQGEGKRVWWEMCNKGIARNIISYSTIITNYSSYSVVIKIFNEMKASDIKPNLKIYNGVIHTLCKCGEVEKAREILKSMEEEGVRPSTVTYNSMITPLCKRGNILDALKVFDEMRRRGLMPTVRTYHAFFKVSRSAKDVLLTLQKMKLMGCCPNNDTYAALIKKFCVWRDFKNVRKLWNEMISNGLDPDRSSYAAMVKGLFMNRKLDEAYKYHVEMKSKGLLPEPDMEKAMQTYVNGKQTTQHW